MALSATSVTWRNVSYPRSNIHIESVDRLDRWCSHQERLLAGNPIRNNAQLGRFCIQLSEDLSDFDWFEHWRNQAFEYYFDDAKRLELNFDGPVPHDYDKYEKFCSELSESLSCRDQFSVRIRYQPKEDLYTSFDLFTTSCDTRQSRTRFELYLGDPEVPCLPRASDTQAWFDLRAEQDEPPVNFTKFRILAIPWHIFTIPQFLGTTYPIQTDLSDSRLLRLELTLEIDAQERDDTLDQVQSFFETISPRIQYLAIRLRLRTDHEDRADELTFTQAFVNGLASCRRLKHLEIGGSGFSPDLPRHLAILPLTSLVLRHVHELPSAADLFQLISPSAVSSRTLKQVRMPQYWTNLIEDISKKFEERGNHALLHEGKREGDYLMRARIISGLVHFE